MSEVQAPTLLGRADRVKRAIRLEYFTITYVRNSRFTQTMPIVLRA